MGKGRDTLVAHTELSTEWDPTSHPPSKSIPPRRAGLFSSPGPKTVVLRERNSIWRCGHGEVQICQGSLLGSIWPGRPG